MSLMDNQTKPHQIMEKDTISDFLKENDLDQYANNFTAEGYEYVADCAKLTQERLLSMGLKEGHAARFIRKLSEKLTQLQPATEHVPNIFESTEEVHLPLPIDIDIVVLVVNNHEFNATFSKMQPLTGQAKIWRGFVGNNFYFIGKYGMYNAALLQSTKAGSITAQAALITAIKDWSPKAVFNVGIAFGRKIKQQKFGDVLVSDRVADFDSRKVEAEGKTHFRSAVPEISPKMRAAITVAEKLWKTTKNPPPSLYLGLIVSSGALVNNEALKSLMFEPPFEEAIGGEMEAYGLYSAANWESVSHWILIKGISDWGDGTKSEKDEFHYVAADNAAQFLHTLCSIGDMFPQKPQQLHRFTVTGHVRIVPTSREESILGAKVPVPTGFEAQWKYKVGLEEVGISFEDEQWFAEDRNGAVAHSSTGLIAKLHEKSLLLKLTAQKLTEEIAHRFEPVDVDKATATAHGGLFHRTWEDVIIKL